uniref:Cation-transporting P-type ATPase N-terminal domain-containing protein n=1 Tax=Rhizochromulina marina TaxID=1034831 RepID=A0A7S2SVN8_9STRA|mmetsp:Transcript_96/g.336  ORF Transcript_96/g.336 Transcript_96/m.336 type:complete len:1170 (+) Transcript_96:97-3606(+)|eukprot:CAMPEP_0118975252 /NCGR_PEP_ID=MMETSP1173-20130426/15167_1 /TAXON_ID=1034831 /ORGANISM="Rhizochromulina marina cf, Strain CCMP1243" /LENGTH=1169 /DNA_ID=CAMNT_0006925111 /DNA_START=44 /DNA_END=3553 /DNA_ORIENTATION=+
MSQDPAAKSVVIPRQFSKTRDQIDSIQDRQKKQPDVGPKDIGDLKREVEMEEHKLPPLEGIRKLADEFEFAPPTTVDDYLAGGMGDADAERLLETHHFNMLTPPPTRPWYLIFLGHLTGGFSLLLWAGGVLCFISFGVRSENVDNLYLGIVLVLVVFLTGCFSYYQEAKSAAVMEGFKNMLPQSVSVIRGSKTVSVEAKYLVPGDVITINTGEKIPADVRIVKATNFKCDQSSLTGEPDAIAKRPDNEHENPLEATNLAFFGTMATEGSAVGFVILTGDDTIMGRIAQLASGTENQETPIRKEIHKFITLISFLAVFLGVTFFIVGFIVGYDVITNLVFMIGIIVANVPEGLLATVTVSLTLTALRLSHKQVLVKNLESVETLGSTTCICSDKTGTLTQNRMTVAHLYANDRIIATPTATDGWTGTDPEGEVPALGVADQAKIPVDYDTLTADPTFKMLYRFGVLCNTGEFGEPDDSKPVLQRLCINGNASDYAFLKMVEVLPEVVGLKQNAKTTFGIDAVRQQYPQANAKDGEIPFNSAYKFMVTVRRMEGGDTMIMKGAAEQVFARCSTMLINGNLVPIDDAMQVRFDNVYKTLGKMGERVLGFAYRELGPAPADGWIGGNPDECNYMLGTACKDSDRADTSDALTYVGLSALIDPPRENVPASVLSCRSAGVKVVMVTGDHPVTAAAIAKSVNILWSKPVSEIAEDEGISLEEANAKGRAIVVPGSKLKDMSQEEIMQVMLYEQVVFARTSPAQKLRIVEASQELGHVVAVTGDGVNDSPALKAADIGCAMGIAGTDVSKEAADMILLSDDFSAIVDGIEEGRLIFDNLKKSIAYTLSSNIPEISPFIMFIIVQMPLSLTTVLILCVDLGTDMLPAISLAYEKPESDIMRRPPRDAEKDALVTDRLMCFAYLQIGVFQALAGFFTFFVVLNDYGFRIRDIPGEALSFDPFPQERNGKIREDCKCGGGSNMKASKAEDIDVRIRNGTLEEDNDVSDQDRANFCPDRDIGIEFDPNWPYGWGCPFGSVEPKKECKLARSKPPGRSTCYKASEALRHGQTAAFVSIVIVQWADLIICKTRLLSLADQGMQNTVMLTGLLSETALCLFLCYTPGISEGLATRPIAGVHWFPSMPFSILIFFYDEVRKYLLRRDRRLYPGEVKFVEKYSYY